MNILQITSHIVSDNQRELTCMFNDVPTVYVIPAKAAYVTTLILLTEYALLSDELYVEVGVKSLVGSIDKLMACVDKKERDAYCGKLKTGRYLIDIWDTKCSIGIVHVKFDDPIAISNTIKQLFSH